MIRMKIDRDIENRARNLSDASEGPTELNPDQLARRVAWLLGQTYLAVDDEFKAFCLHQRDRGGLISVETAQMWRNRREPPS